MRLRDLQAPPWSVQLGPRRLTLRPLSLATFAEAELCGLTLAQLADSGDPQAWWRLLAFLSGLDPNDDERVTDELLPLVLTDPIGFERFRTTVAESFSGEAPPPAPEQRAKPAPRQVKRFKPPEEAAQEQQELLDYGFLLDVARTSGVAVSDLMRMTFYGVTCVGKSLDRLPPTPPMAGLFG